LLGKSYRSALFHLYYLSNITLLILLWFIYRKAYKQKRLYLLLIISFIFAIINAFVTVIAYFEVISPEVMNIPGHHCIYCMWQYSPLSALFTFLFVVGTFIPGWALLLYLTSRHKEVRQSMIFFIKRLTVSGIVFIGTALVLQTLLM